jgi:ATP-dependent helicase Lhr and Lhr-like helicase
MEALAPFSPAVREWFERTFDAPTPAQERGWPAIASGKHTLIQAPTGSGRSTAPSRVLGRRCSTSAR